MSIMSTDEEISIEVRARAIDFCKALNVAGKAGLQINVKFEPSERQDDPAGTRLTNWRSYTTLSRILRCQITEQVSPQMQMVIVP